MIPIMGIAFGNLLGAGLILPLLALLAEGEFGATPFQAALLSASYFAAQFLAAPWLGRLSDRFGRRPVLLASVAGTLASFLLFIASRGLGHWLDGLGLPLPVSGGLMVFYAARIVDGITGGNITIAQAYITDISGPETRAQNFGYLSGSLSLGFIFGPVLGGLLAGVSFAAPFIGASIVIGASLLLTFILLPETLSGDQRQTTVQGRNRFTALGRYAAQPTLRMILILGFLTILVFSTLPATFSLFAERVLFPDLDDTAAVARNVGLLLSIIGITSVITQFTLLKPLLARFGERRLLSAGTSAQALAMAGLTFLHSPILVGIGMMPFAFGRSVTDPSLQAMVTRFAGPQQRGEALGIFSAAQSLGFILGPVWGGALFQWLGPRWVYGVDALLMIGVLALTLVLAGMALPEPVEVVQTAGE